MADAAYPLLRRRRRRLKPKPPRLGVRARLIAIALLAFAGVMAGVYATTRPMPVDVAQALAAGRRTLAEGNYNAARHNAQAALRTDGNSVEAQLLLARAFLELEDGGAAQAALTRARELGVPTAKLHHLLAHALVLQGDAVGALRELEDAPAEHAGYAARVRARAYAVQGRRAAALETLEALVRSDPDDARAWTDLGRLRFSGGEVGAADEAASRAATLARHDPHALTLKGELVRARFGQLASLPWFEAALGRDAYHYPALIEYAATLSELGRHRDMLAAARAAALAKPGAPQPLYLQAVLAARAGNHELARAVLGRAGSDVESMPGGALLAGALEYAAGRYGGAVERWRALLERQPMNLRVRSLLAAALLRSGDAGASLDVLGPVLERTDADPYALSVAARAAEARGDRVRAAALLDRAARGGQGPAAVFASPDAPVALAAAAASRPNDPTFALGLIRGLADGGRGAAAVQAAQTLARAAPGAPAAHVALGDAHAALGRWGPAADAYRRAADLRFDEPTLLRLVDALGRARRIDQAAAALSLFLSQNPHSLLGQRLLGQWQLGTGDVEAAIETLEGVRARVGATDAGLLAELARAYAADGDGTVARRYGAAANALTPMNPAAVASYASALEADGDAKGAGQLRAKLARL